MAGDRRAPSPPRTTDDAEIAAECGWIHDNLGVEACRCTFTAFHPDYGMLDVEPTPPATLTRARRIAMAEGLPNRLHRQRPRPRRRPDMPPDAGPRRSSATWYWMPPLHAHRQRLLPRLRNPDYRHPDEAAALGLWRLPVRIA